VRYSPGCQITAGAPKSPNNVSSTFFNSRFASERPQVRTWRGTKLVSCPRRNLTSLRLCLSSWVFTAMRLLHIRINLSLSPPLKDPGSACVQEHSSSATLSLRLDSDPFCRSPQNILFVYNDICKFILEFEEMQAELCGATAVPHKSFMTEKERI